MKTIKQALIDEVHYPFSDGFIENRLLVRGLNGEGESSAETLVSPEFIGACADCFYAMVDAPNISESGISLTLADRNIILKKANSLYRQIGESEKQCRPIVTIGW